MPGGNLDRGSAQNSQMQAQEGEEVDENGRVIRGPCTLKNGAVYSGQWCQGIRDGYG